jgi:hypothetical protein
VAEIWKMNYFEKVCPERTFSYFHTAQVTFFVPLFSFNQ